MNQKTKYIILIAIVIISISVILARGEESNQVSEQETQREILCVEYTPDNICKHGVDPELWTVDDHGDRPGVIYFCQTEMSATRDRCFSLYANQTSDAIKDKINEAFGTQIK